MKKLFFFSTFILLLIMFYNIPETFSQQNNRIIFPSNNADVRHNESVNGVCNNISNNKYVWIVVRPLISPKYHPQSDKPDHGPVSRGCNGQWAGEAYFGRDEDHNIGERFDLLMVEVDGKGNNIMQSYLANAARTGKYKGIRSLPDGSRILHSVTVRRIRG